MDDSNRKDFPQSFGDAYASLWVEKGRARFNRTAFERLTDVMNRSIAPLKPLLGLFAFTAYQDSSVWSDNSERFFEAWKSLVAQPYQHAQEELPLLFVGFALSSRLGLKRETWGLFLTDSAIYASVSLYGSEAPRRYAYPAVEDVSLGWASQFARRIVEDFDPEGIKAFATLTTESPSFDDDDNAEKMVLGSVSDPKKMKDLIAACLTLALDAFMGQRDFLSQWSGVEQNAGEQGKEDPTGQSSLKTVPAPLSVRVVELGLGDYIKLGSSKGDAKHFKKLASKFGMEEDERILFTFTDSTFAGVYGLAVTDRAIRSRDLMEEPVKQAPAPATISSNGHTLVVGDGPVHFVGEFVPERLMPSVVTLLDEYLAGKIVVEESSA